MNKRNREIAGRYEASTVHSLYEAYDRFSSAKERAWRYCEDLCKKRGGHGLKVLGANSSFFSAGFMFEEEGKQKLMYITHGGDYVIEMEDEEDGI